MSSNKKRTLELLAPARNDSVAISAILAGADAIYIGASSHGARRVAANSIDAIRRVVDAAHPYRAKVYATVNTLVYDNELIKVERLIGQLYRAGVDALIVQDMGLLRLDLPPIELHASTQCDIRSVEKARFLADVGFTRLVLPRELSLEETRAIHEAVPATELEEFIHGALCVSYSGDCRASYMTCGRSANRGECAQICRLPFTLTDSQGRVLAKDRHLLSLRDLNRSDSIADMARAGVSSFKIEGRLKDENYVRNTVAWYSRILDRVVENSQGLYERQSTGRSHEGFTPDPERSFNRGFTTYFLNGHMPSSGLASLDTPKAIGRPVGTVTQCDRRTITARLTATLTNGDGLGYFDASGRFCGFRLNRVDGSRLYPASPCDIPAGTLLYRNRDKEWDDIISGAKASRTIAVDMELRIAADTLVLSLSDERGLSISATAQGLELSPAVTPQEAPRRRVLEKLGDTRYRARQVIDLVGPLFIPASVLTSLRRRAVEMLDQTAGVTYPFRYRLPEKADAVYPTTTLTIHDNVANRKAAEFYRSHGVTTITPAVETSSTADKRQETHVMCTRYCLRRELGKCLLTPEGRRWGGGGSLYLQAKGGDQRFRVDFDCRRCGMDIYTCPDERSRL